MMLLGKIIAVTGAASGIGARTAEVCASLGADVIGIDRVAHAKPVRQKRRAEEQWVRVERGQRPRPRGQIRDDERNQQSRCTATRKIDHGIPLSSDLQLR